MEHLHLSVPFTSVRVYNREMTQYFKYCYLGGVWFSNFYNLYLNFHNTYLKNDEIYSKKVVWQVHNSVSITLFSSLNFLIFEFYEL